MNKVFLFAAAGIVWLASISAFGLILKRGMVETGMGTVLNPGQRPTPTPARPPYDVALLGVSELRIGKERTVGINFISQPTGLRATAIIKRLKHNKAQIKIDFYNLNMVPSGTRYVVWAVSPAAGYTRLGQLVVTAEQNEAKLEAKVMIREFGLFLTNETEAEPSSPKGTLVAKAGRRRTD